MDGPVALLGAWITDAKASRATWSEAFTLATATPGGRPGARAVVLRQLDERGLVFFTDEASRKGRELAANPLAAAVFLWPTLRREARLEGVVTRLAPAEADALFAAAPADALLSLWAWRQGEPVENEAELERRLEEARRDRPGSVPRPPYWVAYRLDPTYVELWREQPQGLHERISHVRTPAGWEVQRLAP